MGRKSSSSRARNLKDLRMNEYQAYYLNRKYRSESKKDRRSMLDTDDELLRICERKGWSVKTNKHGSRGSFFLDNATDSEDSTDNKLIRQRRSSDIAVKSRKHKGKARLYCEVPRRNLLSEYSDDNKSLDMGDKRLKILKDKSIDSSDYCNTDTDRSISDGASMLQNLQNSSRFGNVEVKKIEWYYRSNLQTVIREIRQLKFSDLDVQYLKKTPFWFFIEAITKGDNDLLIDFCKKFDEDIRSLVARFDKKKGAFVLGDGILEIKKLDVVLIFGVRNGRTKIRVTKDFKRTEWMNRCFGDLLAGDETRCTKQLTKGHIYKVLKLHCGDIVDDVSKDVARLMHCYLLAAFFLPNGNTSIAWCLCKYVEDIETIDLYDWCSLIVEHIKDQLCTTSTMKLTGCALLLPYLLCEHFRIIPSAQGLTFPRFMKWDLMLLHRKLRRTNLDTLSKQDILMDIKPSSAEISVYQEHCKQNHVIFPLEYNSSENSMESMERYNSDDLVDVELMVNLSDNSPFKKNNLVENRSFEVDGEEENFVVQDTFDRLASHRKTDTTIHSSNMKVSSVDLDLCLGGKDVIGNAKQHNSVNLNDPLFDVPSCSLGMGLTTQLFDGGLANKSADVCQIIVGEEGVIKDIDDQKIESLKQERDGLIQERDALLESQQVYEEKIRDLTSKINEYDLLHNEVDKLKDEIIKKTIGEEKVESILDETKKELMRKTVELEVFQKQSEEMICFLDNELDTLRKSSGSGGTVLANPSIQQNDEYMVKYLSLNAAHESLISVYETDRETWKCEIEQMKQVLEEVEKKLEVSEATAESLGRRVEDLLNPTPTQVITHPDTIRLVDMMDSIRVHENDKMEMKQYIEKLLEYCKQLESEVEFIKNSCSTSTSGALIKCEPISQEPLAILPPESEHVSTEEENGNEGSPTAVKKSLPPEGTIIRGVKRRTKEKTRKPKQFSPGCQTIVSYNGVPVEVPFNSHMNSRSSGELLAPALEVLKASIISAGKSVLWQGDGAYSYVTSTDAIKVLHNDHISQSVVDSWGELIVKSLTLKDKMTSTFVLTSRVWDCVTRGNSGNRVRYLIDKQLSAAVNCELIIVPLHIPAIPKKGTTGLHQWILLKYNTRNANWTVFNPIPMVDGEEDPYLIRVLDVVKYLESKLTSHLGNTDKNLPIARCKTKMTNELIQQRQTPSQLPETHDDGVIVCHLIEKTLKRHSISSISKNAYGFYVRNTSAYYRGRMVESFCYPYKMNELRD